MAEGSARSDDLASLLLRVVADRTGADEALRLLSGVRPKTWIKLDAALRNWSFYTGRGRRWRPIVQNAWAGSDPIPLLVGACSRDGYLRQRAVASPAMRSDPLLLPVLMIRTADWVAQVRREARNALTEALDAADVARVLTAVRMAAAMQDRRRGDFAVATVRRVLLENPDALATARADDDLPGRRLAYGVWLEAGDADEGALVQAALAETDVICATLCADAIVDHIVDHAVPVRRPKLLEEALAARSARVRVAALTGLVQLDRPYVGQAYLADRSAMMRSTAQWAMRRAGQDPAEDYRALLGSSVDPRQARGLVAGLGECGDRTDVDRIAAFLGHERPRIRAEAVRAMRRLGATPQRIAAMLTDPAPVVVRAATAALRAHDEAVPTARLWELLAPDQPEHVRSGAFRLLIARDTWTRIEADLTVIASADGPLRDRANADLSTWLDHGAATAYTALSAANRGRLTRLIDMAEPALGARKARLLRWHIGR